MRFRLTKTLSWIGLIALFGFSLTLSEQIASAVPPPKPLLQSATFAGGCFWCMESPFDHQSGVISTTSGYTGGHKKNPTYEEVSAGGTGHAEAVQVVFDPKKVTYRQLLDIFWRQIDPTTLNKQFVDQGDQYRTAIFYHSSEQSQQAQASKRSLELSNRYGGKKIVTQIVAASVFYPAEAYHQNFYITHPYKYQYYRWNSGRDQYLDQIWGKNRPH